jgi:DNA-binding SARP family transcriptional activator
VDFRILGPLEVLEDGRPLALGRLKERVVLAVLLLHPNEFVSRERLIDELWGLSPPATARKAVNVYISKLRQTLTRDGHDPIATADGGYRLVVDPDLIDADRMHSLVARARERMADGASEAALRLLEEALAFWRGPTLAGLALDSYGRDEVAQLDELRLTLLMDRNDCDLALGRHEHVLSGLRVLVREHPLRERLRAQQMLALYRADRQADALDAYQQARQTLVNDLGIEPSEALQRLQQAILRHDPALETPTGVGVRNGASSRPEPSPDVLVRSVTTHEPPPVSPAPKTRFHLRRRHIVLASLAAIALAVGLTAFTMRPSRHRATAPRVQPNSLVRLDPRSGKPTLVVPVGVEPGPIVFTPTAIWAVNHGDRTVSRYDLRTHRVQTRGGFPHQPYDVVADMAGNVWVSSKTPIVTRLAAGVGGTSAGPLYPSKTATIRVPGPGVGHIAIGAGYVWAIVGPLTYPAPGLPHREDDRLSLIDMQTDRIASSMRLRRSTTSIAFGYGSAWIGAYDAGGSWLAIISAGSIKPEWIRLVRAESCGPPYDPGPYGAPLVATGAGSVWVLTCGQSNQQQLIKVDPETHRIVKRTHVSNVDPASFLAVGAGSVWLAGTSVSEIDPVTNKLVRTIPVGGETKTPCGIAATQAAVWVAIGDASCDTIGQ